MRRSNSPIRCVNPSRDNSERAIATRRVEMVQQITPALARVCKQLARFTQAVAEDLVARQAVELGITGLAQRKRAVEVSRELIEQLELVLAAKARC